MNTKTMTPDYGFETNETSDGAVEITGKGAGISIWMMILCVICLLPFFFMIGGGLFAESSSILMMIVGFGGPVLMTFLLHRWKRTPYSFKLTEQGIEKNGKLYENAHIGEVMIENGHDKGTAVASSTHVYAGGGAAGLASHATMGAAMGLANATSAAGRKRNYRVAITYGSKKVFLAKHLKEGQARSLFSALTQPA